MKVDLLIKGGKIIDPLKGEFRADIAIAGGKIFSIIKNPSGKSELEAQRIIDAKKMIVCPGFIDMHVHLREPGFEYKEDIESGCNAAAAGGVTTVACMANTSPVNDSAAVTSYIKTRAAELSSIDVLPVGAITKGLLGQELSSIGEMAAAGAVAISDDGMPVMNSSVMRRAMEYAKGFNLIVISHCEDINLSSGGVMHEGSVSTELGLRGMPSASEEMMIARDIALARLTGCRLHIAHVSTKASLNLIRQAKKEKLPVTAEATPHHLTLTHDHVIGYDVFAKVNPPLRTESDRNALINAIADGTIDVISTDHAPHDTVSKERGFEDASFGISGLETLLPLMLKFVTDKKISWKRMMELMCLKPAQILRLNDRGQISEGKRADITIFDPDAEFVVKSANFKSKGKNTPFEGWRMKGKVVCTIANGKVVKSA